MCEITMINRSSIEVDRSNSVINYKKTFLIMIMLILVNLNLIFSQTYSQQQSNFNQNTFYFLVFQNALSQFRLFSWLCPQ